MVAMTLIVIALLTAAGLMAAATWALIELAKLVIQQRRWEVERQSAKAEHVLRVDELAERVQEVETQLKRVEAATVGVLAKRRA